MLMTPPFHVHPVGPPSHLTDMKHRDRVCVFILMSHVDMSAAVLLLLGHAWTAVRSVCFLLSLTVTLRSCAVKHITREALHVCHIWPRRRPRNKPSFSSACPALAERPEPIQPVKGISSS